MATVPRVWVRALVAELPLERVAPWVVRLRSVVPLAGQFKQERIDTVPGFRPINPHLLAERLKREWGVPARRAYKGRAPYAGTAARATAYSLLFSYQYQTRARSCLRVGPRPAARG